MRSILAVGFCVAMSGVAIAQESIVVSVYGGVTGQALESCVFVPFTKETGIKVLPEPGVSLVTFNKLVQQRDNPAIDVAWMDGGVSELAEAAGVVARLEPNKIPNLANIAPQGLYKGADGGIYALSGGFYALGIVYNTDEVKTPPTSWKGLWDAKYANVLTTPSPTNAMGVPFVMALSKTFGKDKDDAAAAFAQLKTLKPAMYFDTAGAADNAFQSREVVIGAHYHFTASTMADQGMHTAYMAPSEGALAGDIRAHVVKNTKKQAQAEKFIDFLARPDSLGCISEKIYFGPPLKEPKISEKARKRMPWGENGNVSQLSIIDWTEVNAKRQSITDLWNREIGVKK